MRALHNKSTRWMSSFIQSINQWFIRWPIKKAFLQICTERWNTLPQKPINTANTLNYIIFYLVNDNIPMSLARFNRKKLLMKWFATLLIISTCFRSHTYCAFTYFKLFPRNYVIMRMSLKLQSPCNISLIR